MFSPSLLSPCLPAPPTIHTNQHHLGKKTFFLMFLGACVVCRMCVEAWELAGWQSERASHTNDAQMHTQTALKCKAHMCKQEAGFMSKAPHNASHGPLWVNWIKRHFHPSLSAKKGDYLVRCKDRRSTEGERVLEAKGKWIKEQSCVCFNAVRKISVSHSVTGTT